MEKNAKVNEIKSGLDDCDVLVCSALRFTFSGLLLCEFEVFNFGGLVWVDSENGPRGEEFAAECEGYASGQVEGI